MNEKKEEIESILSDMRESMDMFDHLLSHNRPDRLIAWFPEFKEAFEKFEKLIGEVGQPANSEQ